MVLRFRPGTLGAASRFLPYKGDRDYTLANPQTCAYLHVRTTHYFAPRYSAARRRDGCYRLFHHISAALPVDPLSSRELDLCLKGRREVPPRAFPCLRLVYCAVHTSQSIDPSKENRSWGAHGTLSVIVQLPTSNGLPLSWRLLTACPRKVLSFQLRTILLPQTLQMHSFLVSFQSMAPLSMCPPTTRLSLLPFTRLNAPTLHVGSPPLSQRSGRTGQQHLGTVP